MAASGKFEVISNILRLRETLSNLRKNRSYLARVGFVPTMGFLHEGHVSLIQTAKEMNDIVVVSVFVNLLQFGPNEDYLKYPRDNERDLNILRNCGVDVAFFPEMAEMFPSKSLTTVTVSNLTSIMCGRTRHENYFSGIATIVAKLFHIVKPDSAFFGMKDAQQVAVIERMVNDLSMDLKIIRCPTVREFDGLAMSSRNVYLNEEERHQAVIIFEALKLAQSLVKKPEVTFGQIITEVRQKINTMPLADIRYIDIAYFPEMELVDPEVQVSIANGTFIVALCVRFGSTNLLDNCIINSK